MCFELLGRRRLRAVLTGADLRRYCLTYEQIDYCDAGTRSALLHILQRARDEVGYLPASGRLFVEIYPLGEGCIIYFGGSGVDPADGFDEALYNLQGSPTQALHPDALLLNGGLENPPPCALYERALSVLEPFIFTFENCDVMLSACTRLFFLYCHRVRKSALYHLGGMFRLIYYPLDSRSGLSVAFLCEYAELTGRGELLAAFVAEHGAPVAEENAIDKISYYFS